MFCKQWLSSGWGLEDVEEQEVSKYVATSSRFGSPQLPS